MIDLKVWWLEGSISPTGAERGAGCRSLCATVSLVVVDDSSAALKFDVAAFEGKGSELGSRAAP